MALTDNVESLAFFRAWLRAPLKIGSVLPSSDATGRAFASVTDIARPGDVLELGSGTGAIAQALLEAGLPPERLVMMEREPDLARHLRRRFPEVRLVEGDATGIEAALEALGVERLACVASTLPIVWFSLAEQEAVLRPCLDRLGEGGAFLQMTNQPASPLPMGKLGLEGERVAHIWRNLPPSFIWRYRRA